MKGRSTRPKNLGRTDATLWKSKYIDGSTHQEEEVIENEYIENLKKQLYFMEMELKLLKEKEKEVEKTGGFSQLFNDNRDPGTHIIQLKEKYATMRKEMDAKVSTLTDSKKEVLQKFSAVKARYEVIKQIEKDLFEKFNDLDFNNKRKVEQLETKYEELSNERMELETTNKLTETKLGTDHQENLDLELSILHDTELTRLDNLEFDNYYKILLSRLANKSSEYERLDNEIKELDQQQLEDPLYKIEFEKNGTLKEKIKKIEREVIEIEDRVEELEAVNKHLLEKKDKVLEERKRLYVLNDELKKEIENKTQLSDMRIQKRVKDNNSVEISNLNEHTKEIEENIQLIREKIKKEQAKTRQFSLEKIKLIEEQKEAEKKKEEVIQRVDAKMQILGELKDRVTELEDKYTDVKAEAKKNESDNTKLKHRNKTLRQEYAAVKAQYDYILANYDCTSNIKRINLDDIKNVSESNNVVNQSIENMVDKLSSFKKKNRKQLL